MSKILKSFFFLMMMVVGLFNMPQQARADKVDKAADEIACMLHFDLETWSFFYKSGKGDGVISCDNGQKVSVKIKTYGGGITFGKSHIVDGEGSFTKVPNLEKLFGSYASTEAHAGAKTSKIAKAMTKGKESLTLTGSGEGYDLGFAFGSFKIIPTGKIQDPARQHDDADGPSDDELDSQKVYIIEDS